MIWTTPCENVSGHMQTAKAQITQRICTIWSGPSPLTATKIIEYYRMYEWRPEQRPRWYFMHAQDDINLHMLRMFEGLNINSHRTDPNSFFFFFFFFVIQCCRLNCTPGSVIWRGWSTLCLALFFIIITLFYLFTCIYFFMAGRLYIS